MFYFVQKASQLWRYRLGEAEPAKLAADMVPSLKRDSRVVCYVTDDDQYFAVDTLTEETLATFPHTWDFGLCDVHGFYDVFTLGGLISV